MDMSNETQMYSSDMWQTDYFTETGLTARTGIVSSWWDEVIVKELIDNSLDAIQNMSNKKINIELNNDRFCVFDSGHGISVDQIKDVGGIYDFKYYASRHRFIKSPSRGRQGNGLKCIIGICHVWKLDVLWHTSDGVILKAWYDGDVESVLEPKFEIVGSTDKRGIEIRNPTKHILQYYTTLWVKGFSECNRDTSFEFVCNGQCYTYDRTANPESSDVEDMSAIGFYSYSDFCKLIRKDSSASEFCGMTYKMYVQHRFGERLSKQSKIKCLLKDVEFNDLFESDFESLRTYQKEKPFTLLRKRLLGFDNLIQCPKDGNSDENNKYDFPAMIEFSVSVCDEESENTIACFLNNSIMYEDGGTGLFFDPHEFKINTKTFSAKNMYEVFKECKNYNFRLHIITATPRFKDYGKTSANITAYSESIVTEILSVVQSLEKKKPGTGKKRGDKQALAFKNLTEAYKLASSDGKHSISARQMYYKLRELCCREDSTWEGKDHTSTYNTFTQEWLTEWMLKNPEYEDKIFFADRGKFIVDGQPRGLGTLAVTSFNRITKSNTIMMQGSPKDKKPIQTLYDFDAKYKYRRVLYVEKSGFEEVFREEQIAEKYGVILVYGQGYGTRAAKNLLYKLGVLDKLQIFCLHDYDCDGIQLYNKLMQPNDKFPNPIPMIDLGVTLEDIAHYHIEPEIVETNKRVMTKIKKMPKTIKDFLYAGPTKSKRVELNAFTTEQLLEIIDKGLSKTYVPEETFNLSSVLKVDTKSLVRDAFIQIMLETYDDDIEALEGQILLDIDHMRVTYSQAKRLLPSIEADVLRQSRALAHQLFE